MATPPKLNGVDQEPVWSFAAVALTNRAATATGGTTAAAVSSALRRSLGWFEIVSDVRHFVLLHSGCDSRRQSSGRAATWSP